MVEKEEERERRGGLDGEKDEWLAHTPHANLLS